MEAFLSELPARHPGGTVLLVGHGGTILALMFRVLGIPLTEPNRFYCSNGGLSEFALSAEGWRLVSYNDTSHLLSTGVPPASSA